MRTRKLTLERGAAALALATLGLAGNHAFAAEYWLRAAATTVEMPNPDDSATPSVVPMWGYAKCTATFDQCTDPVTIPGPALTVPPGDTTLTVHLRNDLTVPTSLVINGLVKPMAPVWTDGTSGPRGSDLTKRVRSFDAEAAPNAGTPAVYTWTNVRPGTYLYQSGTQPQVQVQMGLYGAVTNNAVDVVTGPTPVRGQAYAATATQTAAAFQYDNQATLLYSEIDPALHTAVATAKYGVPCPVATPDCGNPTSTFNYAPKYFLVNGQPYPFGTPVISPAGNPGTTLLRMLNAGLMTHVPMIQGTHWTLVAEDGKPYSYRRDQYTALLPAAKTVDLLLTPGSGGVNYAIMDRRLSLSNAGSSDGGMLAVLQYGAVTVNGGGATGDTNQPPVALDDTYSSIVGVALNVGAPEGVLMQTHLVNAVQMPDYDPDGLPLPIKAVAASGPTACAGGSYALNTNGSFVYMAPAALPTVASPGCTLSSDSFTYQITDGKALSAIAAKVTINLSVPSAPTTLATLDDFNRGVDTTTGLGGIWAQTAATAQEPDVQVVGNVAKAVTTGLGGLAIWNSTLGATQGAGFSSATPLTNAGLVLKATGGTPAAPANYVRVRCESTNGGEVVIATMMGGSNVSVFVKQAAFAAAACGGTGALSAVVDAKGLVTAFLNGAYVGGVQLPDVGAWKGSGNIGIQLQSSGGTIDNFIGGAL